MASWNERRVTPERRKRQIDIGLRLLERRRQVRRALDTGPRTNGDLTRSGDTAPRP